MVWFSTTPWSWQRRTRRCPEGPHLPCRWTPTPSLFIALLDQLVASVWASDVFLKPVDLQTRCKASCVLWQCGRSFSHNPTTRTHPPVRSPQKCSAPHKELREAAPWCFASLARNHNKNRGALIAEAKGRRGHNFRERHVQERVSCAFGTGTFGDLPSTWRVRHKSWLESLYRRSCLSSAPRWGKEVGIIWESLWRELFPSNSAGIERHHRQLSAELAFIFSDSNSRTDDFLRAAREVQFRDVGDFDQALLGFVKASALYDGIGVVVRALAAVTALLHRRRGKRGIWRGRGVQWFATCLGYCSEGSREDRTRAVEGLLDIMVSFPGEVWRHKNWWTSEEFGSRTEGPEGDGAEEVPGNPQSPAEELLTATLNLFTGAFEQCRRGVGRRRFASADAITPSARRSFRGSPRLPLLESIQGADGHQIVEISQSGLLLASSLATDDSILGTVKRRAELVLLTEDRTSPLFRDGEVARRRL